MREHADPTSGDAGELVVPGELTSFVGRESETEQLLALLADAQVVTLTGPGGVGKSRMATHIATRVTVEFPDGVAFVPLAELGNPDLVASAAAEALGTGDRSPRPPLESVLDALGGRRMLVVLDNCEHLLPACAALASEIARTCTGVVVLATSRQSLGLPGERVLPVGPLTLPDPDAPLTALEQYDAVALLADRARAVVPTFAVTEDNAAAVSRLCRQLDGLPLAIELAAIRLRALSVSQVTERLEPQLALSSDQTGRPDRHASLQTLIDWSHQLCTEEERLAWARLSIFAGPITLEAAESICPGGALDASTMLDVIDRLVDKSILLREEQDGIVQYRMLATVRQYGAERLGLPADRAEWQQRHCDYFSHLADEFAATWMGPSQLDWIRRLKRERSNFRAAMEFCAATPELAAKGLQIAYDTKEYWLFQGFQADTRIQVSRLLAAAPPDAPRRSELLSCLAFIGLVQSDPTSYRRAIEEAESIARRSGDAAVGYVLLVRGYAALINSDMPTARARFGDAQSAMADSGDESGRLWARYNLGLATALAGDREAGLTILRECIASYDEIGDRFWRSWALWSLAAAEYLAGDIERARVACDRVLRDQQLIRDRATIAFALTISAGLATARRAYRDGARLFGAATAAWDAINASPLQYAAFVDFLERDTAIVVEKLGATEVTDQLASGYALTLDEAINYALGPGIDQPQPQATTGDHPELTRRELEVAQLVAQGLTNRQIADELAISTRTAETHVTHILTKLELRNRSQLAIWVTDRHHTSRQRRLSTNVPSSPNNSVLQ